MTTSKKIRDAAEQTYRWQKKIEKQLCGRTPKEGLVNAIETDSKHNVFHGSSDQKLAKRNILRKIICDLT